MGVRQSIESVTCVVVCLQSAAELVRNFHHTRLGIERDLEARRIPNVHPRFIPKLLLTTSMCVPPPCGMSELLNSTPLTDPLTATLALVPNSSSTLNGTRMKVHAPLMSGRSSTASNLWALIGSLLHATGLFIMHAWRRTQSTAPTRHKLAARF